MSVPSTHGAVPQLHDYILSSAARRPDHVALVTGERRYTYREIDRASNALAHALVDRGIARGDRVIVFGDNTAETVIAFWAVLKANGVVVMVSPQTKEDKLAYLLNDCRAAGLISEQRLAPVFTAAVARSEHMRAVVVSGAPTAPSGGVRWEDAIGAGADSPPPRRNVDIDLAAIIYTSGSTGEPKGVMLTHRNMLTAATSVSSYLEMAEDEVVLCVLPLSFDYGLYQMIMTVRVGGRLVLERSFAYLGKVLKLIADEQITALPGVPTLFAMLGEVKTLSEHDLSRIRLVTNTAAALSIKHIEFLRSTFSSARVYSMYGLTECKRCTYLPPKDLDRKPLSVGIAIPNTEMWIVDEAGNRVGPNVVGQLVIRGATVMRGYWEKPEATARRLKPGPLPGEMVLHTGDFCRMDEDGYLYFVGRMDDVIKSRGEKVAPKEVESALVNIPGVKEAAVIGVPDEVLGQAVKAFVSLEEGATLTEKDLQRECGRRLESFMVPKEVVFVREFPRTDTGKINKPALATR